VRSKARRCGGLRTNHRHFHVWRKMEKTDLDDARPLLATLYSDTRGRTARDPVSMLRSCLAMTQCGVTSFDAWVPLMRDDPFHALLSGFDPQDTPGVGTFYDFQDRLLQRPRQSRTTRCRPRRRRDQRDKADHHKDKNDLRPHQDIVNRLADRILARDFPLLSLAALLEGYGDFSALPPWQHILQPIFYTCFVARSAELDLIDFDHLYAAGDGSKLPTARLSSRRSLGQSPRQEAVQLRQPGQETTRPLPVPPRLSRPLGPLGLGQLPQVLGLWLQLLRVNCLQLSAHLPTAGGRLHS
jgi:hypothetical protein